MIPDLLPQFLPQCCDAVLYLLQGETCATRNDCYDQLRPIGAQLWFSIPYRLDLPAESLIAVHWLMLFISVALSVRAITTALQASVTRCTRLFLYLCSTLVHLVFFWPVMQLALTDAPAALFALIAIWLLIAEKNQPKPYTLALAGLLLGLSAWIRFAYLYPVLGMLAIYILLWLFNTQRQRSSLLLLTALLPILLQYGFTFLHHQTFGFLGPAASAGLSSEHSLSIAAGQETILPQQQYLWPTNCEHKIGIEQALHEKDFSTALCLMANRFDFSFGSYSPDTYMFAATNLLTHTAIEHVGLVSRWRYWEGKGIDRVPAAAQAAPDGSNRMLNEKLVVTHVNPVSAHEISASKRLPVGKPYTFSVWLWSTQPQTISLMLRLADDKSELAHTTVAMNGKPTRYAITATLPAEAGWFTPGYRDLEVALGTSPATDVSLANANNEFYAWGAQLEQSAVMTAYQGPEANIVRSDFRVWSPYLLAANLFAMLSVLLWFYHARKTVTPAQVSAAIFMALVVAEIIVTQPEQRFVIAVEIYIWVYALLFIYQSIIFRRQQTLAQVHRSTL